MSPYALYSCTALTPLVYRDKPEMCAFHVQMVPMAMYFGYMFIVSYSFFCLTGTIGFFACLMFCKKIYSAVKID